MFRLWEEVLAEAQLGKTRALRVRRSTKILLPPMPEQIHAKRQSTQTPNASSQCRCACKKEVQQPEEDVRSSRLSVRLARKKASPEDDWIRDDREKRKRFVPKTSFRIKLSSS